MVTETDTDLTIHARIIRYETSRGEWKTLLVQRDPTDEYEAQSPSGCNARHF